MYSYAKEAALRQDFMSFARHAFAKLNDGERLTRDPYIKLLSSELMEVADGKTKRLLINLPPRHAKTFLASIALSAWVLAHHPSHKIMVLTHLCAGGQPSACPERRVARALAGRPVAQPRQL
jgi:hypothetical protein